MGGPIQDTRERVQSLTEMSRATRGQKATKVSPAAMLEVMAALDAYWDALEASDLSHASKGIYMSQADNFVRWMRGDFNPGSRNAPYRSDFAASWRKR
jgi:hypothetical protein